MHLSKDKSDDWVTILEVTDELCNAMMAEILQRILRLLESAEILLDNGGNETICAGLYTYAVEEYGKFLLLKQSNRVDGTVTIEYRHKFRKHTPKIDLAIKNLPPECKDLRIAVFDPKIFDPNAFDTRHTIANFEARMAVFYTDFTASGDEIKSVPPVNAKRLRNAINELRRIALCTDI